MASPDVFQSSPLREARRERVQIESSSPALPSLQDLLSQKPSRPPIRSGSKAVPIPDHTPSSFIAARHLLSSTEGAWEAVSESSAAANRASTELSGAGFIASDTLASEPKRDDDIVIVQISGKSSRKPRKPRAPKTTTQKKEVPTTKISADTESQNGGKGKKASKANKKGDEDVTTKAKATKPRKKQTGTMSNHFPPIAEPDLPAKSKKNDVHEPLHLEQAPARRLDWTPPAQKTVISIDSDSSAFKQLASSETDQPMPVFKNLIGGYACLETAPQTLSFTSDEDSGFLKKRKLIELVNTKEANPSAAIHEKSPKKKAPKKKARTITELATAAYKLPTQPDPDPPTASILEHFKAAGNANTSATEQTKKAKGKANPRKRASKVSKKKAAPPKPILLSPGAALAQVANQDFVFGTSSQLAREESPTVLRDLQSALMQSNQVDDIDFATPINSDAIDPPEPRTNLWDAAARDTEGDLFNVEVINLTEDSPHSLGEIHDANPFGYFGGGNRTSVLDSVAEDPVSDDHVSFTNLSDLMPSPTRNRRQRDREGSPFFSDSDLSTSIELQRPAPAKTQTGQENLAPAANPLDGEADTPEQPPRPNFEGYTDIQLAKEIRTFGFKPIKRRSAMIALLDQCWQSKTRMGQAGVHTSTKRTSSAPKTTKPGSSISAGIDAKRPRGRPRKNSPSASEPQEPPPSAQPPETPKRPRGRPRKDSLASSLGTSSPAKAKAATSPKKPSTAAKSPRRKKGAANPVIEIPDSNSDFGSDLASSPDSSMDEMFSPPPLDLSLSTGDDTELSLTASQNDQEVVLFEYIAKAIRSAPRTTDPTQPSWHEKILLYDPIILEDLAAWLNTGELSRVGYDGEVNPNDVKKWCESQSICCLWRVNLRGKERKRF
ncbi:5'-flap endonuclease [Fusarium piperis]|uniref:Structure-specific endonuclease subunit SLX4 n=1 Tax=Fusarium piperis TaxID=1435070 RepID=A0A9W9BUU3_9HYPO|nr:5'-flap endonuclease [Fusarium piperis]